MRRTGTTNASENGRKSNPEVQSKAERHRQFGVLVTTSQAYKEIRDDQRPIIVIAARDIVQLLMSNGLGNPQDLANYLHITFPQDDM